MARTAPTILFVFFVKPPPQQVSRKP